MEINLVYFILGTAFVALAALIWQVVHTFFLGRKTLLSENRGDWKKGVIYAFGKGMMPWEKESAKKHLLTYSAGFGYHFGIFSAFLYLCLLIIGNTVPHWVIFIIRYFMISGLLFGVGLLIKRMTHAQMQLISCPDDYVSNVLVDIFLSLAILTSFTYSFKLFFMGTAGILMLYIPVGKIRHCFFFFYSRILFGRFFGRRGVFPKANMK